MQPRTDYSRSGPSKLRSIEKLNEPDRKAVLRFADALLVKQRLEHQRG